MTDIFTDATAIEFEDAPPEIDALLRAGVIAHRSDRKAADRLFRQALDAAPHVLATYFCLYKILAYMGRLDEAAAMAVSGITEATHQLGWPAAPDAWPAGVTAHDGPARFALFSLKALAFIELKRGDAPAAQRHLAALARLDPQGQVGWTVIAELAQGVAA